MNRHLFVAVLWLGVVLLSLSRAGAREQSAVTTPQAYLPVVASLYPPTPPPMPSPEQVIRRGNLLNLHEIFGSAVLRANITHSYKLETVDGEQWSVEVNSAADLVLSVWLDGVLLVDRQNHAPARAAEVIGPGAFTEPGVYEIWVMTQDQAETRYAIAPSNIDYPIVFNGFMTPGNSTSNITAEQDEEHFWFFEGMVGQTIRLHLETGPDNDGLIVIYGPRAKYLDTADDGFWGEPETYRFTLPETGLYAFAISDIDYAPMVYSFELTVE